MQTEEDIKVRQRKGVRETVAYLQNLSSGGFYGTLEVRFEAGNVVHLAEHRSLKPFSLTTPDKLRSNNEKRET